MSYICHTITNFSRCWTVLNSGTMIIDSKPSVLFAVMLVTDIHIISNYALVVIKHLLANAIKMKTPNITARQLETDISDGEKLYRQKYYIG